MALLNSIVLYGTAGYLIRQDSFDISVGQERHQSLNPIEDIRNDARRYEHS
jgi:hypothetical protein